MNFSFGRISKSQHKKGSKHYVIRSKQEKNYCILLLTIYCYCLLFTAYFLMYGKTAFASECQWIETTGEVSVGENIAPSEAKQLAKNKARMNAIENVSGIRVKATTLVKNSSLSADLINTLSSGYIIKEEGTVDCKLGGDISQLTCIAKLKSCVAQTKIGEGDSFFQIKAKLNRDVFMAGEEARIEATCTKDCYLTIINLTADDKAIVLLPNEYEPSPFIKAEEPYSFPRKGLGLEMYPLEGHKKNEEAFILIATKEEFYPLLSPFNKGGKGGVLSKDISKEELYKALLAVPADSRAEEMLVYEVREK